MDLGGHTLPLIVYCRRSSILFTGGFRSSRIHLFGSHVDPRWVSTCSRLPSTAFLLIVSRRRSSMLFTAGVSLDWNLGMLSRVGLGGNAYGGSPSVYLLSALGILWNSGWTGGRLEECFCENNHRDIVHTHECNDLAKGQNTQLDSRCL
jgi:hypothetical protein